MAMFNRIRREPSRELVPVDDVVGNLPFIVRRDHRIVAAFAKKALADEWAQLRSFNDESRFTVHTATEVIVCYQDGETAR
jgi:hypothetical protein